MKAIADFYVKTLIKSDKYFSPNQCKDETLLLPEFLAKVKKGIKEFNIKYPAIEVIFVETYRSNALQLIHYNNGASQIKKNGMHHYGIAVDCAYKIDGKFSYNGDYKHLRQCMVNAGLYLIGTVDKSWDLGHFQHIAIADQTALRNAVDVAVRAFQSKNGLVSDGIVGKLTQAKARAVFA